MTGETPQSQSSGPSPEAAPPAGADETLEELWRHFLLRLGTILDGYFREAPTRALSECRDGDFLSELAAAAADSTFGRTGIQNEFLRMVLLLATGRKLPESGDLAGIFSDLLRETRQNDEQVIGKLRESMIRLLDPLRDDVLREMAVRVIAGATRDELARDFACSLSSVDRKLRLILQVWTRVAAGEAVTGGGGEVSDVGGSGQVSGGA